MKLHDLAPHSKNGDAPTYDLASFLRISGASALGWPDVVSEQWLLDHAAHPPFLDDYGHIDLRQLSWGLEMLPLLTWLSMKTGPSDESAIEDYAREPEHFIKIRRHGIHRGVAEAWQQNGTWKRPPLVIDRALVHADGRGLQLIEGRTRVGILVGRHRLGHLVAAEHLAWVARPKPA